MAGPHHAAAPAHPSGRSCARCRSPRRTRAGRRSRPAPAARRCGTGRRPWRAHSWDCRHRLGFAESGQSPPRKENASLSQTTRPLASLTTHGSSEPISPRSASAKSARSSTGRSLTQALLTRGPSRGHGADRAVTRSWPRSRGAALLESPLRSHREVPHSACGRAQARHPRRVTARQGSRSSAARVRRGQRPAAGRRGSGSPPPPGPRPDRHGPAGACPGDQRGLGRAGELDPQQPGIGRCRAAGSGAACVLGRPRRALPAARARAPSSASPACGRGWPGTAAATSPSSR